LIKIWKYKMMDVTRLTKERNLTTIDAHRLGRSIWQDELAIGVGSHGGGAAAEDWVDD
jgi:hypothetical protein